MLQVPVEWIGLPAAVIERKLQHQQREIIQMLATEVERHAGSNTLNLTALRQFLDERDPR